MKKTGLLSIVAFGLILTGCGSVEDAAIQVYTRDTTSGTRDGFFTTIGFSEAKTDNSVLVSNYVEVASNGDMISAVKNDVYGIGYISLASLSDSDLTGLRYEGIEPTEANVLNETYALKRNFNYVIRDSFDTPAEESLVEAFVAYMNTQEGKATIQSKDGIVSLSNSDPSWDDIKANYPIINQDNSSVTLRFGGSTSAEKVAKALSADFSAKAGNFVAEHNHTGSGDAYKRTQGSEKDGANKIHIGFASREFSLTSSEPCLENTYGKVCTDAIVTVINSENDALTNITAATLKTIYQGTVTLWSELA